MNKYCWNVCEIKILFDVQCLMANALSSNMGDVDVYASFNFDTCSVIRMLVTSMDWLFAQKVI